MKLTTILNEIRIKQLLIVDIQPAHKSYISNSLLNKFTSYLNDNIFDNITFLFNGRNLGYSDTPNTLQEWLIYDLGVNENLVYNIDFVEKEYGFFRGAMGISIDDDIVKIAKYMIKNYKNDSRDITEEEFEKNHLIIELFNNDDGIYIPSDLVSDLKHINNPILIGGGKMSVY